MEHEFDRRVEEFNFQSNGNDNDDERVNIIPVSLINNFKPLDALFSFADFDYLNNTIAKCNRWNEWIRWKVNLEKWNHWFE